MKNICVFAVCFLMTVFGSCYAYQIKKGKAVATTSTWLIFLVGCGLSFISYVIAENRDLRSGIMNTGDVVYAAVILITIFRSTKQEVRFKPFEKWYLAGAGAIVVYGLITGDAWKANILTQLLISFAYLPMFHKLYVEKKKSDSYFAWVPNIFIASIAVYPAMVDGNSLSVIYSVRSFSLSLLTTLLLFYYQTRAKKVASAISK